MHFCRFEGFSLYGGGCEPTRICNKCNTFQREHRKMPHSATRFFLDSRVSGVLEVSCVRCLFSDYVLSGQAYVEFTFARHENQRSASQEVDNPSLTCE